MHDKGYSYFFDKKGSIFMYITFENFKTSRLLTSSFVSNNWRGWSGGTMVLGKLPMPGRPTFFPSRLSFIYHFSPPLWEAARYRLKYRLKGSLNPKTTNQPTKNRTTGPRSLPCCLNKA